MAAPGPNSLLSALDWPELEKLVRAQQRNREVHTPAISTFRWWARRSHALIGALLESAASECPGRLAVADPFSGGGTVALEAARRDIAVYAQDLHPWAVAGLRATLDPVDPEELERAGIELLDALAGLRSAMYSTRCPDHGDDSEQLTAFWVRVAVCPSCEQDIYLFPYSLVTRASRVLGERAAWWGCQACGAVSCAPQGESTRPCPACGADVPRKDEPRLPGRVASCPQAGCGMSFDAFAGNPHWKLALVQRRCRHGRRWYVHFAEPTAAEVAQASARPASKTVPKSLHTAIPAGLETRVLRRTGLKRWSDLYAPRQLQVLAAAVPLIDGLRTSVAVKARLRLALCGCAEMAGYVSRWDRYYPKAFEAVANHRFAVTGLSCETNLLAERGRGTLPRRLGHSLRAARWAQDELPRTLSVSKRTGRGTRKVRPSGVVLVEGSSESQRAATGSIDLVLTDPPYFDDVQYAELAGVFLAWARAAGLVATSAELDLRSEAVANVERGTDAERYRDLLAAILAETRRTLSPGGRMILTYHNTDLRAWWALGDALRRAGFRVAALAVTHAENERDHAKRGRLAFSRDLVIECRVSSSGAELGAGDPEVMRQSEGAEATELVAAGRAIAAMPEREGQDEFRARFRALRGQVRPVRIGRRSGEETKSHG